MWFWALLPCAASPALGSLRPLTLFLLTAVVRFVFLSVRTRRHTLMLCTLYCKSHIYKCISPSKGDYGCSLERLKLNTLAT